MPCAACHRADHCESGMPTIARANRDSPAAAAYQTGQHRAFSLRRTLHGKKTTSEVAAAQILLAAFAQTNVSMRRFIVNVAHHFPVLAVPYSFAAEASSVFHQFLQPAVACVRVHVHTSGASDAGGDGKVCACTRAQGVVVGCVPCKGTRIPARQLAHRRAPPPRSCCCSPRQ